MAGHQRQRQGQLQQVIWIQKLVNLEVSLNIFSGRPTLTQVSLDRLFYTNVNTLKRYKN